MSEVSTEDEALSFRIYKLLHVHDSVNNGIAYVCVIYITIKLGHNYGDLVKEDKMARACSTNDERTGYRILVGKRHKKRTMGRPRLE
jgi:hypothetical protein